MGESLRSADFSLRLTVWREQGASRTASGTCMDPPLEGVAILSGAQVTVCQCCGAHQVAAAHPTARRLGCIAKGAHAPNFQDVQDYLGLRRTRMTESPRRNILLMNRSLLTGVEPFLPLPVLGISVHISFTFSRTMLQCLSKAFTRPSNFRLFLQLIRTCELVFTLVVSTESGPVRNSSSSFFSLSSTLIGWAVDILPGLCCWKRERGGEQVPTAQMCWIWRLPITLGFSRYVQSQRSK
mmetsp:Transcript_34964/g.99120  ORF Transcript_34964/g.99120 Transcript_34964/m.99120 type:complete len:239 (-) Transcript_34964:70-786(-)